MSGEDFAMTGPSGRGGHFCWAGCGKTRRQSQLSAATDGGSLCGAQHAIVQSLHLLWLGDHLSGLDARQQP